MYSSTSNLNCEVFNEQTPQVLIVSHSYANTYYTDDYGIHIEIKYSVRNPPSSRASDRFIVETELLDVDSGLYYKVEQPKEDQ